MPRAARVPSIVPAGVPAFFPTGLLALTVAWALVTGACITPAANRKDALLRTVHEYNDGVRWKRYEHVLHLLAADEARRFAARTAAFGEDYEMADEEIVAVEPRADDDTRARVTVGF